MPPNQSEEAYTSLEVFRPAIGAEKFLGKAHHYGYKIFGNDGVTSITERVQPSQEEAEEIGLSLVEAADVSTTNGAGAPRLVVYEKIRVPLLTRRSPVSMNVDSHFKWLSNEINKTGKNKGELRRRLDRAGLQYGITNESPLELWCDGIRTEPDHYYNSKELVWVPHVRHQESLEDDSSVFDMLGEEAGICFRALLRHSPKARFADGKNGLNIPFARFPRDSTKEERDKLEGQLAKFLPVRLVLKDIDSRIGRSKDKDPRKYWPEYQS